MNFLSIARQLLRQCSASLVGMPFFAWRQRRLKRQLAGESLIQAASADDAQKCALLLAEPMRRHFRLSALSKAAAYGHTECVRILAPVASGGADRSFALYMAASFGHPECVELLIPVSNPRGNGSHPLILAAYNGCAKTVALLIPVSDPLAEKSRALRSAAENGHAECVKLLLPFSNHEAQGSEALRMAAAHGHFACVELLAPLAASRGDASAALALAATYGNADCVDILIPCSDPRADDSLALRLAVKHGCCACARSLLHVSAPLIGLDGILASALAAGRASVVALILEAEPRLVLGASLSTCLDMAPIESHGSISPILSSAMDKLALAGSVPAVAAILSRRSRL